PGSYQGQGADSAMPRPGQPRPRTPHLPRLWSPADAGKAAPPEADGRGGTGQRAGRGRRGPRVKPRTPVARTGQREVVLRRHHTVATTQWKTPSIRQVPSS